MPHRRCVTLSRPITMSPASACASIPRLIVVLADADQRSARSPVHRGRKRPPALCTNDVPAGRVET